MRTREKALRNLLGTENTGDLSFFPATITLPDQIHSTALEAVNRTVEDGHERSVHLRYRNEQWREGPVVRGDTDRINLFHLQSTLIYPPHLHIHTHPLLGEQEIQETLTSELPEDVPAEELNINEVEASFREVLKVHMRVPSDMDAYRSLKDPPASVGHLLSAATGNFLWVHKDLRANRGVFVNSFSTSYREKCNEARKSGEFIEQCDNAIQIDASNAREVGRLLVASRVAALSSDYVCYLSDDIEDPILVKSEATYSSAL